MRNLKRVLSLALAAMMLIGMMVVSAGAASTYDSFTDKDEIVNTEAVNTMVSLGVLTGKPGTDGTLMFDPTATVKRGEMAKIIAICLNGGKEPVLGNSTNLPKFSDVPTDHWAYDYIAYCVQLGIIAGHGDGTFGPEDPVTGSQAAKMFLCALGYRADLEGLTGAEWELNTNILANQDAKLYVGLEGINASQGLTRDNTAQMCYNAVQAEEVQYDNLDGNYSDVLQVVGKGTTMLGSRFNVEKVEGIVEANEVFGINGRSATVAGKTYLNSDNNDLDGAYPISMDNDLVGQRVVIYVRYNNKLSPNANESTVLSEPIVSAKTTVVETSARLKDADAVKSALKGSGLSMPSDGDTNGEIFDFDDNSNNTTTTGVQTVAGVRQRFIDNTGDGTVDLIIQEKSALAKVTVYNEKDEKLTLSGIGSVEFSDIANEADVALNDYVLVNKLDDTYYLTKAETVEGEVTAYNATTPATITIDGTNYTLSANTNKTVDLDGVASNGTLADTMVGDTYRLYLDAAGNIIFAEVIDEAIGNYAVITGTDTKDTIGFSTAQVKLTKSDGTSGTYDVDLLATAKRWNNTTDDSTKSDAQKEQAMARALKGLTSELVTYTINDDNTVVLGKPQYINSTDYVETGAGALTDSDSNKLYSSDSSYKVGGTAVVMDNTTVFFIKDDNGVNVVVGLKNLPSKGVAPSGSNVNVIYEKKTSINTTAVTNVASAVYLTVTGTYASNANYVYISSDYSSIKENGDTIYSYDVVFTDGTTGTIKTKDTVALTKGMAYSYTLDNKGYADLDTDSFTVNNVYVDEVGNNTVVLLDADNYATSKGSYPLASDIQVWNVEDTDDVYTTSLGKTSVASLVLNDDGEIKYAFVNEVRGDEMTAEPSSVTFGKTGTGTLGGTYTGAGTLLGADDITFTGVANADTLTLTVDFDNANQTASYTTKATGTFTGSTVTASGDLTDNTAATILTVGSTPITGTIDVTVTIKDNDTSKISRVINYTVAVSYPKAAAPTSVALTAGTNAITVSGTTVNGVAGDSVDVSASGWVTGTADEVKITVTDSSSSTTCKLSTNGGAAADYTSGTDIDLAEGETTLVLTVTATESGKLTETFTYTFVVTAEA